MLNNTFTFRALSRLGGRIFLFTRTIDANPSYFIGKYCSCIIIFNVKLKRYEMK